MKDVKLNLQDEHYDQNRVELSDRQNFESNENIIKARVISLLIP